jgi:hypothetical protein
MQKNVTGFKGNTEERKALGSLVSMQIRIQIRGFY